MSIHRSSSFLLMQYFNRDRTDSRLIPHNTFNLESDLNQNPDRHINDNQMLPSRAKVAFGDFGAHLVPLASNSASVLQINITRFNNAAKSAVNSYVTNLQTKQLKTLY